MKNTIIIIIILIIIIGGSIFLQNSLNSIGEDLSKDLEELKNDVGYEKQKENNNNTNNKLEGKAEIIYDKWEKESKKWAIFVLHEELDRLETALINIKSTIQTEDFKETVKEINYAIFLVDSIKDKEKIKIKNLL